MISENDDQSDDEAVNTKSEHTNYFEVKIIFTLTIELNCRQKN